LEYGSVPGDSVLGGLKLKNFISTFFACLMVCGVAAFFFAHLIFTNIWAIIILVAFLLAVFITVLISYESRIEELEKKMEQLLNKKQG
jgi:Ca2+-dependent lipid-binding protein